ncbi:flagellar hook-length control protein FliK [Paenibacillus barcinonensis]|uniref:flagellar hook-length control protein FliK n=1 Tax=Paenibacillus barcinonensis TaxID=198119 RepID=UPI001C105FBD|nr:flagellar hook-length control protein FliK [Paenibacillus barcinonensis]MBU5350955.1 flagellar hook-length control protein FliK [Paenibacillus barcinonensis]
MSLVFQMNSTASAGKASGSTQASGAQSKDSVTTGGEFLQTLAQSLVGAGGNGQSTDAANGAASQTANPLVFTFASDNEGEDSSLNETLSSLFADTDKLDLSDKLKKLFGDLNALEEALENDPALLNGLQTLIQQLYALLNNNSNSKQQGSSNDNAEDQANAVKSTSAMELSQHPAAVRFVLQDLLTQLAAEVKKPDRSFLQSAPEFKQLLQELQTQLKQASVETDGKKGWAELRTILDTFSVKEPLVQTVNTAKADSVQTSDADVQNHNTAIVTAGELSLRSSGTAAGKPAEPVMHASLFAKEMTKFVVNKLDVVQQKGFSEATISLRPEHLGKLDVQITLQNGQLVARFMTEHVMAKDMLEQQMMQLRSSLQSQGIQVERLEVTQNSSLGSEMYQDGGRQQGSQSQQQRRSRERGEQNDEAVTAASLQEELRNWRSEQVEDSDIKRDSFSAEA